MTIVELDSNTAQSGDRKKPPAPPWHGEVLHSELLHLGSVFGSAKNTKDAAELFLREADRLLGWDAAYVLLYNDAKRQYHCIAGWDLVGGKREKIEEVVLSAAALPMMEEVRQKRAIRISRSDKLRHQIGDVNRKSESSLFSNIYLEGGRYLGVVSLQSYTLNYYTDDDIATLRILTDFLAATLLRTQAHAAFLDKESLYQKAITAIGAIVYEKDYRSGTWVNWSEGVEELVGIRPEEINRQRWIEVVQKVVPRGENEGADVLTAINRTIAGKIQIWKADVLMRRNDGPERWLADTSVTIFSEDGVATGSMGILQDITDRKNGELALQRSEERYRMMVEAHLIHPYEYHLESKRYVFVSNRTIEFLQYPKQQILEPDFLKSILPKEVSTDVVERLREHHQTLTGGSLEYPLLTAKGEKRWVRDVFSFGKNEADEMVCRGLLIDLTELKASEHLKQVLSNLGTQLSGVTSSKNACDIVLKAARELIRWDAAYIGFIDVEVSAFRMTVAFDSDNDALTEFSKDINRTFPITETLRRTLEGTGRILDPEEFKPNIHRFGYSGRHTASKMDVPIRAGNGECLGVISLQSYTPSFFDESHLELARILADYCSSAIARTSAEEEHRKIQEQMLQAQKMESLGLLAGGIAHDFNNLLVGVLGNSALMKLDLEEGSAHWEIATQIETTAERMRDLTSQLLAYTGRGKAIRKVLDLNRIIHETSDLLRLSISRDVHVKLQLAKAPVIAQVVESQFRQVIINLVINAAEAMADKGGNVCISTYLQPVESSDFAHVAWRDVILPGDFQVLEVTDDGCGMDSATMERIFDPFFTTKFAGRGLGLAALQGIIRSHKGFMAVTSEVGKGSTFKVYVPASNQPLPPEEIARSIKGAKGTGLVMLVDDEAAVSDVLGGLLTFMGFEVIKADCGDRAVEYLKEGKVPKVIFLDLLMPDKMGDLVLAELRAINPNIPTIIMSGFVTNELRDRFADERVEGFLEKPFKPNDLATILSSIGLLTE